MRERSSCVQGILLISGGRGDDSAFNVKKEFGVEPFIVLCTCGEVVLRICRSYAGADCEAVRERAIERGTHETLALMAGNQTAGITRSV
jgi:hypothetical protein